MADEEVTKAIRGLSNELRIRILEIIAERPAPVGEIASSLGMDQPKISVHLAILLENELVSFYRNGKEHYYRVMPERLEYVINFLENLINRKHPNILQTDLDKDAYPLSLFEFARTCHDHLAGSMGVELLERMLQESWLSQDNDREYFLTEIGQHRLSLMGIDPLLIRKGRRKFAYGCLDATAHRYHLGGALGAEMLKNLIERGIVKRQIGERTLVALKSIDSFFQDV